MHAVCLLLKAAELMGGTSHPSTLHHTSASNVPDETSDEPETIPLFYQVP